MAEPFARSVTAPVSPPKSRSGTPESWKLNMTWNSGVRDGSRAGPIASMTASTGVSDQASASTTVAWTWSSNSAKDIWAATLVRRTRVLTIMPSNGSNSGRPRFAAPVPTSMSCWPVYRYSSAAKPAYMVVNSDTRCCLLNERSGTTRPGP